MRAARTLLGTVAAAAALLLPTVQAQDSPAATPRGLHRQARCPSHPSARGYAVSAYDWTTGTAYLFGGVDEQTPSLDYPLFDVWSYSTAALRWTLRLQSDRFYNAFQRDAIALDPFSRKVVLYSTFVNCTWDDPWYCGVETWIYDIRRNTFRNVTSGTEPPLRWGSRMVYDARSRRAILFGGSDGYTAQTLNDTWAFDFETNTWTLMGPAVSPPPHHFAAMAYHPLADRVVLFGGYDIGQDAVLNDTWVYDYDTNTWTELHPDASPSPRLYHAMSWDAVSNRMILFGGVSYPYEPLLGDTWSLDLKRETWTLLTPAPAPSARAWHVMEGTWSGVLLFGGSPQHEVYTYDDTWVFDSRRTLWIRIDLGTRACPAF
jgi:hypothetical protein